MAATAARMAGSTDDGSTGDLALLLAAGYRHPALKGTDRPAPRHAAAPPVEEAVVLAGGGTTGFAAEAESLDFTLDSYDSKAAARAWAGGGAAAPCLPCPGARTDRAVRALRVRGRFRCAPFRLQQPCRSAAAGPARLRRLAHAADWAGPGTGRAGMDRAGDRLGPVARPVARLSRLLRKIFRAALGRGVVEFRRRSGSLLLAARAIRCKHCPGAPISSRAISPPCLVAHFPCRFDCPATLTLGAPRRRPRWRASVPTSAEAARRHASIGVRGCRGPFAAAHRVTRRRRWLGAGAAGRRDAAAARHPRHATGCGAAASHARRASPPSPLMKPARRQH